MSRAAAAAELVVGDAALPPPKIRWKTRVSEPLVRLAADRVERERAVAGAVVADRGHAACVDGQLRAAAPRSAR